MRLRLGNFIFLARCSRIVEVEAVTVVLAEQPQVFELRQHKLGSLSKLKHGALVLLDAAVKRPRKLQHLLPLVDCKDARHRICAILILVHESLPFLAVHFKRTDVAVIDVHRQKITDDVVHCDGLSQTEELRHWMHLLGAFAFYSA
jgi:hypothetical protein